MTMKPQQKDRRETNPALGRRKLKLGTFQTNLDSGCVMSDLDGRLDITWPNTVTLAQLADEMNFEALVPVARWRGFGGAHDPQRAATVAAGNETTQPQLLPTSDGIRRKRGAATCRKFEAERPLGCRREGRLGIGQRLKRGRDIGAIGAAFHCQCSLADRRQAFFGLE